MNYKKEFIKRGLLGSTIGVFINQTILVFIILFSDKEYVTDNNQVIFQYIISILVGIVFSAGSVIFEIEEWSLLRQTTTHFVLMSTVFFIAAYYAGWMPKDTLGISLFVVFFLLIYVIMWFLFKSYWDKKIKEVNEELRRKDN